MTEKPLLQSLKLILHSILIMGFLLVPINMGYRTISLQYKIIVFGIPAPTLLPFPPARIDPMFILSFPITK